ncbi:MAG: hypothetical protein JXX29_18345 [Deltaproteobacteria bacterium]|nr:hypothetical protein [Deltaproteobacteria bacterium]MBN2673646.1 hypothetical protein [Deltaproteobacteria bacterium]
MPAEQLFIPPKESSVSATALRKPRCTGGRCCRDRLMSRADGAFEPGTHFLQKPFTFRDLLYNIHAVLYHLPNRND